MKISNDFDKNMAFLKEAAADSPDYIIIERKLKDGTRFLLCYIDNMINSDILNIRLLPAIMGFTGENFDFRRIPASPIREVLSLDEGLTGVATGGVFFLIEGHMKGFQASVSNGGSAGHRINRKMKRVSKGVVTALSKTSAPTWQSCVPKSPITICDLNNTISEALQNNS